MRILIVTVSFPYGSGESFLYPEVRGIIERGHEVLIVPRSPKGDLVFSDLSPFVVQPHGIAVLAKSSKLLFRASLFKRLMSSLLCKGGIQSLLKNLLFLPKALWLSEIAQKCMVNHIHAHWVSTTASMAMIASELTGIPWSLTAHRGDIVANNCLQKKLNSASFSRFISLSGIELAQSVCGDIPTGKAHLIRMGVRLEKRHDTTPCQEASVPFIILTPAGLIDVKGHKFLIDAAAILNDARFDFRMRFAGQGVLESSLREKVRRLGLEGKVEFLGQLSHQALLELYRNKAVHAVALPSLDLGGGLHEGIPVSLIEAMSASIPVISTTTGGIPELVLEGTGILVPPANANALAEAIIRLIQIPELSLMIGRNGRRRVESEFNINNTVEQLVGLMQGSSKHFGNSQ